MAWVGASSSVGTLSAGGAGILYIYVFYSASDCLSHMSGLAVCFSGVF